jgi:phosphotransferase system  glucose/maltose/N-acetylglucosamine-specific IIC component
MPVPFRGVIGIVFRPAPYPFSAPLTAAVTALDGLELAGIFLAIGIGIGAWRKAASDPLAGACVFWSITMLTLPPQDIYSAARILSPLMLYQFLDSCRRGRRIERAPIVMVTPRILAQLAPQAAVVAHALVHAAFTIV